MSRQSSKAPLTWDLCECAWSMRNKSAAGHSGKGVESEEKITGLEGRTLPSLNTDMSLGLFVSVLLWEPEKFYVNEICHQHYASAHSSRIWMSARLPMFVIFPPKSPGHGIDVLIFLASAPILSCSGVAFADGNGGGQRNPKIPMPPKTCVLNLGDLRVLGVWLRWEKRDQLGIEPETLSCVRIPVCTTLPPISTWNRSTFVEMV